MCLYAGQGYTAGQAMTGKIRGKNGIAAMCKKPALKHPCQMILATAMQKDQHMPLRVEIHPAGCDMYGGTV
jgi:hypothetical protein